VPPKLYGGTERVVHWLTEELVALGHDVTLFASGDSRTSAKLDATWPRALRLDGSVRDPNALHMVMLERVRQKCDKEEFDFLHFHLDYYPWSLFYRQPTPFVTTLHGRLDLPALGPLFQAFREFPLVSISDSHRAPARDARWEATIHHGLPETLFECGPGDGGYLAFLGRMSPEKRPDLAIDIAERLGMPLKMAAKVDRADEEYFEGLIAPKLKRSRWAEWIGELDDTGKNEFLGRATALLFPVDWPEPFGLAMIESLACGTPVIAFDRGSVPEVVRHGVNGFIVDDVEEAVRAVESLGSISRADCRADFEQRFSAARMADDYLGVYERLVSRGRRTPRAYPQSTAAIA
jgi:glycosyltransferase involved in cell wall biosynthesis